MIFKQISVEALREEAKKIKYKDEKHPYLKLSYLISYPEFIAYFEKLNIIEKHHLIIGVNFVYGWMPTIFDFRSDKFDDVLKILNELKRGKIPKREELETLKKCFNNSLVGTSKLLHFINPSQFAIWDSRVCRYLTNKEPHSYVVENINIYFAYLELCKTLADEKEYMAIHKSINLAVGYEMTPFRTLELIMYSNGGLKNNK